MNPFQIRNPKSEARKKSEFRNPNGRVKRRNHEIHETHETQQNAGLHKGMLMQLLCKEESYAIMGACFEVYKDKGHGFREPVCHECLELELALRKIPFVSKAPLKLLYKGAELRQCYVPDLLCYERIILEVKAVQQLLDEHRAQLLNYLKATRLRLGILVNFGHYPQLEHERIVL